MSVGLFITHEASDRVLRHFHRLKAQSAGLVDWHLVDNSGGGCEPSVEWSYLPASKAMPPRYKEFVRHGGLMGGYLDVAVLPLAAASDRDFVWVMEYDVDYSGDWSELFLQFDNNRADLLTTTLVPREQSSDWYYWPTAKPPPEVESHHLYRAFHPLMRLSRRFARWYLEQLCHRPWSGHYEYLLPTAALWGGFRVEDIGGDGPLCPENRKGRNYQNTPNHENLTPGTFVFRPARERYFHESPEEFASSATLYHPVKPGTALWKMPRASLINRGRAWLERKLS